MDVLNIWVFFCCDIKAIPLWTKFGLRVFPLHFPFLKSFFYLLISDKATGKDTGITVVAYCMGCWQFWSKTGKSAHSPSSNKRHLQLSIFYCLLIAIIRLRQTWERIENCLHIWRVIFGKYQLRITRQENKIWTRQVYNLFQDLWNGFII